MIRPETFRVGARELAGNKTRTALTTLGIVFGVAAVIAMVSIAQGARFEAEQQIASLGTSTVRVKAVQLAGQELSRARQVGVSGLSFADADSMRHLPGVASVAPIAIVTSDVAAHGRSADARIVGTTAELARILGTSVEHGRFVADEDERLVAPVVVLGAKVAHDLLPFQPAVGATITIGGLAFQVIGVMEDRRQASSRGGALEGADLSRDVYMPASTARLRFPVTPLAAQASEIVVRVEDGVSVRRAAAIVRDLLGRRHAGIVDFEVVVPEELLRQSQKSQRTFNIVMGAIASISLLVGGIGIMNVMLVTVIQRTQEIGIRRAVGATRKDIRDQFLVEALTIAVLGGLAGVVLGSGLALVIASFAGWVTIVSPVSVLVAFLVAGITGVGFGIFPAMKASRMDPIECLRRE
jgi:putative ABC transport system permease protein